MNTKRKQKLFNIISSKLSNMDETTYLLKSKKNAARLAKGISAYNENSFVKIVNNN